MPSNTAAWLISAEANPLQVQSSPYNSPHENEIVIKNLAVAINPADWLIQERGGLFPHLRYPTILGSDVAGEVVEVGSSVTRFKIGDRVTGFAVNLPNNTYIGGGFQTYTVLLSNLTLIIPDSLSYEQAAVIPLGVSTAASALFQKDYLALEYPSLSPTPTGKTLLVWSGSSSVGGGK